MNNYKEQIKNMKEISYNELIEKLEIMDDRNYPEKLLEVAENNCSEQFHNYVGYYCLQFKDFECIKVITFDNEDNIVETKHYI